MTELLPCPFCGEKGVIEDNSEWNYRLVRGKQFSVGCETQDCFMFIRDNDVHFNSEEAATTLWNNRADVQGDSE